MRAAAFRALAGLLAVAFVALLAFGDTAAMALRTKVSIGVIAIGFGLFAAFGTDLGERFIWVLSGGRDPKEPSERR